MMAPERRGNLIEIDKKLDEHMRAEDRRLDNQEERLKNIEDDLGEIKTSIKGLLDAWNAANAIGNFLKWVAGIGAGVVIIYETIKHVGGK